LRSRKEILLGETGDWCISLFYKMAAIGSNEVHFYLEDGVSRFKYVQICPEC
jgi:hypothetical protein